MGRRKSKKHRLQAEQNRQAQAGAIPGAAAALNVEQASRRGQCPLCGVVLERAVGYCSQCRAKENEAVSETPIMENRPFKPYANIRSPFENDLYKFLAQAFSETDPRERPWCGIGVEVGFLAVSPTNVIVADIRELNGVQQAVVQVPQNWREPWHVETADGARHQAPDNPCDQAERAFSAVGHSLGSFLNEGDQPTSPCIKHLIVFPDGYKFKGSKEFFILDRAAVLTLKIINLRDLSNAISEPAQQQRLDSQKYRTWIEESILRKSDESILGTWLDPAFDEVEAKPAKKQRRRLDFLRRQEVTADKKEVASSNNLQRTPIRQKFKWRQSKRILTIITVLVVGIIGWRVYDRPKALTSVSYSYPPLSPPDPVNSKNDSELIQAAMPLESVSLPEHQNRNTVSPTEVREPSEAQSTELNKKDRRMESARKTAKETPAPEDSELRRQQLEREIHEAIGLRAIDGVTVNVLGDTAHLTGRVDTESQKSAAELAARSVPGVKQVRSSIEIQF